MPARFSESISVVMPALDEVECVDDCLERAVAALQEMFDRFELILVDDGSTDGTAERVEALQDRLPQLCLIRHPKNLGYGRALRTGFEAARHDLVFFTDADGQFDLAQLAGAVPLLASADVVLGYRRVPRYKFTRRMLSRTYNVLVRWLFGVKVRDVDCSFKLFRRHVVDAMQLTTDDFFIDTEIVAQVGVMDVRTVEYPVDHFPRHAGSTTVRASHIPRTLWTVAKMFFRTKFRQAPATNPASLS